MNKLKYSSNKRLYFHITLSSFEKKRRRSSFRFPFMEELPKIFGQAFTQEASGDVILSAVTNIMVRISDHDNNIAHVTVTSDGSLVDEYEAFLVEDMLLHEYLANQDEVRKASLATKGRFAFPEERFEDNLIAYNFSVYTDKVINNIEEQRRMNGGEARKHAIRAHYDNLRPTVNQILEQNTELSDHRIAKKLNELGYKTVNQKDWRDSNVRGMLDYFQGNPSYTQRGKGK